MSPGDLRRRALGEYGEKLVARWYESNGYRIVARNWRCKIGEIDIVAIKGSVLVVCEVKTRSSAAYGLPVEAITHTKARRLRQLAAQFLTEYSTVANELRSDEVRFDVGSVQAGKVEVLEGVF